MKIERLNSENIKDFLGDLNIEDAYLENSINRLEVFGIKEENTFYMAFEMVLDDDRIAIRYINNKLSSDKFFECISYLSNSLVVNSHLIINIYDNYYRKVLGEKYGCKDIYVSSLGKEIVSNNGREEYAEIDMLNIKYHANYDKSVLCNLVRQNIQDEELIKRLHSYFRENDYNNITFIISPALEELFINLGYKILYKSYVIKD